MSFKNGDSVYVSLMSRSKVAGEIGVVKSVSARGEVKVVTAMGVVGYPDVTHVTESRRACHIVDTDVESMYGYSTVEAANDDDFEDPTDLLGRVVRFQWPVEFEFNVEASYGILNTVVQPWSGTWGFVSDQWIEDGVELLNIVFAGTYKVVPRSFVTNF